MAQRLADAGYRVVIHDRRNCGLSDVAIGGEESEFEQWADDLHALLHALGATRAFVGGVKCFAIVGSMPLGYHTAMELRHLRYFIAVAETEHFHRAASLLRITQPALSRQIKELETELGTVLFERLPRGVRLNRMGRNFLRDARRIVGDIEVVRARMRQAARNELGPLRIAFSEAISGHPVLTHAILDFQAAHPNVDLLAIPMPSAPQVEALREGRIDAGFQYRLPIDDAEFNRHEIVKENILLAIPQSHSLARRKIIRLADLEDQQLVCLAEHVNHNFFGAVITAFESASMNPRIIQETSSTTVLSLVDTGMGIGIISSAMRWHIPSGIVLKMIKDFSHPTSIDLVCRKQRASTITQWFVDNTKRVAGSTELQNLLTQGHHAEVRRH